MTENERITIIRKAIGGGMSMEAFGVRIGVTKATVSRIESGSNAITDHMRRSICREFHVNEGWLRTGEGEMFAPEPVDMIGRVAREYGLDAMDEEILRQYASLPDNVRDAVKKAIIEIASKEPVQTDVKRQIEEELEDYRRQLELEDRPEEGSAASRSGSAAG